MAFVDRLQAAFGPAVNPPSAIELLTKGKTKTVKRRLHELAAGIAAETLNPAAAIKLAV